MTSISLATLASAVMCFCHAFGAKIAGFFQLDRIRTSYETSVARSRKKASVNFSSVSPSRRGSLTRLRVFTYFARVFWPESFGRFETSTDVPRRKRFSGRRSRARGGALAPLRVERARRTAAPSRCAAARSGTRHASYGIGAFRASSPAVRPPSCSPPRRLSALRPPPIRLGSVPSMQHESWGES